MNKSYSVSQSQIVELLIRLLGSSEFKLDFNSKRNKIDIYDKSGQNAINIKLPWILPSFEKIDILLQYTKIKDIYGIKYQIILVQAGYGAVGRCAGGQLLDHKLIRKYMVRKKQGKAQITYLHSKGKSRAGSRIRLAQTVQFFEEINQQVNAWLRNDEPDRLLIHCPPRLWGLLFQSKIKPEFEKKDNRIIKIPTDVKIPDKKELIRVNEMAQKWIIETDDSYLDLIANLNS